MAFRGSKYEGVNAEATTPKESEAKTFGKRKPEIRASLSDEVLKQRAEARKAQSKEKWSNRFSKWGEKLKSGVNYAFSIPDRVANRYGQAKDVGALGVYKTAEGAKAAGRGVKAAGEFGLGVGVTAVAETYGAGKQAVKWGKEGLVDMGHGIERSWDATAQKFNETRTRISESARDKRGIIMNGVEMLKYKAETVKQNLMMAAIRKLEARIGLSQKAQDQIQGKFQQRMEARGVDYQALGIEQEQGGAESAVA